MNKIITIGREFGSGGRELAKRLAEKLGYKYYDKEIIAEMIKESNFDEKYIENIENNAHMDFPYTISKSFSTYSTYQKQTTEILVLEQKIIKKLASKNNCVFVGRCADIILRDMNPCNIFVYANTEFKISRCRAKVPEDNNLSDRQLLKKFKNIDKARKKHSLLLGCDSWGIKENYDLCVNTSNINIKDIVPIIAKYTEEYFKERK